MSNFLNTFTKFLSLLKVRVTKTSAEYYLETHPEEGSMLAYTDALNHFQIENAAAKITVEDLKDLPTPIVTFLQVDGGTFTIIKSIKNNTVLWLDKHKGWVWTQIEEFTVNWSGIVLLAETDKESGEKDFTKKRISELLKNSRMPLAIGMISVLVLISVFSADIESSSVYSFLLLKLAGIIISCLLFIKSVDNSNLFINKICTSGLKVNCQSILDSPAAKITSWFSWSDAGFIYFFGSFFGLLFCTGTSEALRAFLSVQRVFRAAALLFASYSLYYQAVKAKMWCTLCLGVVTIFVFESVATVIYFSKNGVFFDVLSILKITLGFMVPIAFLLLFKDMAIKAQESKKLRKELIKLKSNPTIFQGLMAEQPLMPDLPQYMPVVLLGNKDAAHTITFVSNPLCTPCANMHLKIERLTILNENINCQVLFLSNLDSNDPGGKFVRKVFSLPEMLQAKALHSWFERNDKNFELWNEQYKNYPELGSLSTLQGHNKWANHAEVKATPTLFIDGRLLPEFLNVEDLNLQFSHVAAVTPNYGFANHEL